MNASSRFPRSASTSDAARGFRVPAWKVALGAAVLGVSLFNAAPATLAAEVTNPADNPVPITVTIDGQQYRDGLDTLPGYDDYACTPIPNVEYDFAENKILYHDDQGNLADTARWTEWDRISSYTTWKKQQQASSTPTNSNTNSNTSPSTSTSSSATSGPSTDTSSSASTSSPAASSSPAAASSPAPSSGSSASTSAPSSSAAANSSASSSSKGSKSSSKGSKNESSSKGADAAAGGSTSVAGAGTVAGAGAATANEPGKDGEAQAAGAAGGGNGGNGGAAGGDGGGTGVPGAINAAGNALVSGPPAPAGVTPAVQSVGKVVASGAGNTRLAGLLILAVLTIAGLVLFLGNFARRAAFGPRGTGQAV